MTTHQSEVRTHMSQNSQYNDDNDNDEDDDGVSLSLRLDIMYILKGVMSVCMLSMAGRTAGPIKIKLGTGTHVDPGSVLVKVRVKVIYLCVRYNGIHACLLSATPGE